MHRGDSKSTIKAFEAILREGHTLKSAFENLPDYGTSRMRDLLVGVMQSYASQGQMENIRSLFAHGLEELESSGSGPLALFEAYLEILTHRSKFSRSEVMFVLHLMEQRNIAWSPTIYLHLMELHIRMAKDPRGLWDKLREQYEDKDIPFSISKLLLDHVVLHQPNNIAYVLGVVQHALRKGKVDSFLLSSLLDQWCSNAEVPPETALWLLFQLEQRCLFDKVATMTATTPKTSVALLLRCAKCGDARTGERVVGFLERNLSPRNYEILGLMVWCYSSSEQIEKALDTLEMMARKGLLDGTDPFKKFSLDSISTQVEKHFMMMLVNSLKTVELTDRAFYHLEARHKEGNNVSVHSLDCVILACSMLGEESRAIQTLEAYSQLGVQSRTISYNCLLMSSAGKVKSTLYKPIFEAMTHAGVPPNSQTFRMLIRQSVWSDRIDEAIEFLESVPKFQVRVDVEMLLPIIERAAAVGDAPTARKIAKFSLDCDIGLDEGVLKSVVRNLIGRGQNADSIRDMMPAHAQLRSKAKVSRRRSSHNVQLS